MTYLYLQTLFIFPKQNLFTKQIFSYGSCLWSVQGLQWQLLFWAPPVPKRFGSIQELPDSNCKQKSFCLTNKPGNIILLKVKKGSGYFLKG